MDKILTSIKKLLGIQEADTNFDQEIIMHINSAIMVLAQLGIGPVSGYKISSDSETWTSLLTTHSDIESVKSYIYLKVRLLFDPPQNTVLIESMKSQIEELEWRLQVQVEPYTITAAFDAAIIDDLEE